MNYGEKVLKNLLEDINKMSVETYNNLLEEVQCQEKVNLIELNIESKIIYSIPKYINQLKYLESLDKENVTYNSTEIIKDIGESILAA